VGSFYNGYSWPERMAKYEEMLRRFKTGELGKPQGPCRLCGDPGSPAGEVEFEYHDEDYSKAYSWAEPAAFVLCRHCHQRKVHMRFAQPIAWKAYLAHVRRGGYARDLQRPDVDSELDNYRRALKSDATTPTLKQLRPYAAIVGEEWFSSLTLDWNAMLMPASRPRP
jgi:hypothetical protein